MKVKLNLMKDAPDNGEEVLLMVKRRAGMPGKFLVGHYQKGGHCIDDHPPIAAGWYFWNGYLFDVASEPVGWLPLPDVELDGMNDASEPSQA